MLHTNTNSVVNLPISLSKAIHLAEPSKQPKHLALSQSSPKVAKHHLISSRNAWNIKKCGRNTHLATFTHRRGHFVCKIARAHVTMISSFVLRKIMYINKCMYQVSSCKEDEKQAWKHNFHCPWGRKECSSGKPLGQLWLKLGHTQTAGCVLSDEARKRLCSALAEGPLAGQDSRISPS